MIKGIATSCTEAELAGVFSKCEASGVIIYYDRFFFSCCTK